MGCRLFLVRKPDFIPNHMWPYNNQMMKNENLDFKSFLKEASNFRYNSIVTKMIETLVEERRSTFDMFIC